MMVILVILLTGGDAGNELPPPAAPSNDMIDTDNHVSATRLVAHDTHYGCKEVSQYFCYRSGMAPPIALLEFHENAHQSHTRFDLDPTHVSLSLELLGL